MGLWVLSECVREWVDEGSSTATSSGPAEPRPQLPVSRGGDRHQRRRASSRRATCPLASGHWRSSGGLSAPDSPGELTRLVLDSLALAYRRCVATAARPRRASTPRWCTSSGVAPQNELLCQLTADALRPAGGRRPDRGGGARERAGPGSRAGSRLETVADMRALVRRTHELKRYEPVASADWTPWSPADRSRPMPASYSRRSRTPGRSRAESRVALQVTCINDAMFPDTGKAMVTLLRRLGVDVEFPEAQTCCGQPMVNTGYLDEAVPVVRHLRRGVQRVRRGRDAVRVVRRVGAAPAPRSWRGGPATPRWSAAVEQTAPTRLRADRVPRRRARRDRRGRVLPAPGDLPPDLPLAADARRRRPATDCCSSRSAGCGWSTCPPPRSAAASAAPSR